MRHISIFIHSFSHICGFHTLTALATHNGGKKGAEVLEKNDMAECNGKVKERERERERKKKRKKKKKKKKGRRKKRRAEFVETDEACKANKLRPLPNFKENFS